MAYFPKKNNNKGTYQQIYESFYDPQRRAVPIIPANPLGMSMNSSKRELMKETITGHFLICCLAVLLTRLRDCLPIESSFKKVDINSLQRYIVTIGSYFIIRFILQKQDSKESGVLICLLKLLVRYAVVSVYLLSVNSQSVRIIHLNI